MKDTAVITIGQALTAYRLARSEQDYHLRAMLNITAEQLTTLQAQPFPRPRRTELGEGWIDPNAFYVAINVIAEMVGIQGVYRDQFESMLLWYCHRQMEDYRAAMEGWLATLEQSYQPNTSFNNQMAQVAFLIMREMRAQLR